MHMESGPYMSGIEYEDRRANYSFIIGNDFYAAHYIQKNTKSLDHLLTSINAGAGNRLVRLFAHSNQWQEYSKQVGGRYFCHPTDYGLIAKVPTLMCVVHLPLSELYMFPGLEGFCKKHLVLCVNWWSNTFFTISIQIMVFNETSLALDFVPNNMTVTST